MNAFIFKSSKIEYIAFQTTAFSLNQEDNINAYKELFQDWHHVLNTAHEINKISSLVIDISGVNWLYLAARHGLTVVVKELLLHGANVNQADMFGCTALYMAAQNGYLDCVIELLKHGAEVNRASKNGSTPFYIAAQNGHVGIVKLLLENGADWRKACKSGVTPLAAAICNEHWDVVKLLEQKPMSKLNVSTNSFFKTQSQHTSPPEDNVHEFWLRG